MIGQTWIFPEMKQADDITRRTLRPEKKYGLEDKDYVKEDIKAALAGIFHKNWAGSNEGEKEARIEMEVRKRGRIYFDVNGLKAVNDLFGKSAGDKYLDRIADTLANDQAITDFISKHGIKIKVAREGGDEFTYTVLSSDTPLDEEFEEGSGVTILQRLREIACEQVEQIDMSQIAVLDENDPNQMKKLGAIGQRILKEAGGKYTMKASVAGGEATYLDAINTYYEDLVAGENGKVSDERQLELMMNAILRTAEERGDEYKQAYKEALLTGGFKSKFLGFLYCRTKEARKLYEDLVSMQETVGIIEEMIDILEEVDRQIDIVDEQLDKFLGIDADEQGRQNIKNLKELKESHKMKRESIYYSLKNQRTRRQE